jgi:hypothetical protein
LSDRPSYEWVQPPRWRRWLLRLLVLIAFVGVGYGLYTIISEGTKDDGKDKAPALKSELENLQRYSEQLSVRIEGLKPGKPAGRAKTSARRALTYQRRAIVALRRRQAGDESTPQEREIEDALNAEFDWFDAVNVVLRNPDSKLIDELGTRGEDAIDSFNKLDDDYGNADSIRGVSALTEWAQAR